MIDGAKSIAKVKVHNILCSSSSTNPVILLQKVIRLVRHTDCSQSTCSSCVQKSVPRGHGFPHGLQWGWSANSFPLGFFFKTHWRTLQWLWRPQSPLSFTDKSAVLQWNQTAPSTAWIQLCWSHEYLWVKSSHAIPELILTRCWQLSSMNYKHRDLGDLAWGNSVSECHNLICFYCQITSPTQEQNHSCFQSFTLRVVAEALLVAFGIICKS